MRPGGYWIPWSPCDPSCLPATGSERGAPTHRRYQRYALTGLVLVAILVTALSLRFVPAGRRPAVIRQFCRWLLDALGVRLAASAPANPASSGTLIVANHVSWLDVIALLATEPAGMLAKRETHDWPLVGAIADRIGTLYTDRERLRALPATVAEIAGALRTGRNVVVFPEATTWCGVSSGRFRPAMFQAAVDAGAAVRPVTVRYLLDGRPTTLAAFIGEDTLLASLRRIVAADGLTVQVTPHPSLTGGTDRRLLARAAEAAVTAGTRAAVAQATVAGRATTAGQAAEAVEQVPGPIGGWLAKPRSEGSRPPNRRGRARYRRPRP